ncbi:MAG: hypothetical protein WBB00_17470 [Mycobacterium sp.]
MTRPPVWKVVTVGAAMTGLGLVGAGAAGAATPASPPAVHSGIEAPTFDWVLDSTDEFVTAMDDSWDDTWDNSWEDSWDDTWD